MSDERTPTEAKRSASFATQGISPAPNLESLAPHLLATVRRVADALRPQARLGTSPSLNAGRLDRPLL